MSFQRLAILSMHTSPLAQPGVGDGGGMNVYVRSLGAALARAGVACDVYTRAEGRSQPRVVQLEPGLRVVHVEAGPLAPVEKEELAGLTEAFGDAMFEEIVDGEHTYDALHANYWLSGRVAHVLKHRLSLPLVATFHTLARVKAEMEVSDEPELRSAAEAEIIRCSDMMLASTGDEALQLASLYNADASRIEVVPPGVDHRVFAPGDRHAARAGLGLGDHPVLLFVGRIQPLKGVDLAIETLAALDDSSAVLVVVGGPSGRHGDGELRRVRQLAGDLGVAAQVRWVPPQHHHTLVAYYRAADVCLMPSRSESFGLVALEAAACGTPVVASAVGGLLSIVEDRRTGFLVEGRRALDFAKPVTELLNDHDFAEAMGRAAAQASMRYSWNMTGARMRRLYADLAARSLVECN